MPAQPDHTGLDPRIRRTRQLLQDGLRSVLRQKPLDKVLVLDITEAATVNRATFYDHYADKFELFDALVAADFQKLLDQRNVCFDGSCPSGLATLILSVGDFLEQIHRDHTDCSRQASSGPVVDAAITLAVRRIILDGLESKSVQTLISREVAASLIAGAIYGAVKETLSNMKWRVDETALLSLVPLILPVLEHNLEFPVAPAESGGSGEKQHPPPGH